MRRSLLAFITGVVVLLVSRNHLLQLDPKQTLQSSAPESVSTRTGTMARGEKALAKTTAALRPPWRECSAWCCICDGISIRYNTSVGDWGTATAAARTWWTERRCNTQPDRSHQDPNPLPTSPPSTHSLSLRSISASCPATSPAAEWGCTCQGISDRFGTFPGRWNDAIYSESAKSFWMEHKCATLPSGCAIDNVDTPAQEPVPPAIPHVLWQTGPAEQRAKVDVLVAKNRKHLPSDFEFHYIGNDERDKQMRELSELLATEGVVEDAWGAYANLVPYTYRVDLWKASVIWAYGGLYMDHKVVLERPWSSWVDVRNGRLSICQDRCHESLFCAFFAAAPRSPALVAVIRRHVAHIKMHFDGYASKLPIDMRPRDTVTVLPQIGITSPLAWGWALEDHDVHVSCWFMEHIPCRVPIVSFDKAVHQDGKRTATGNNYDHLWESGRVYCDRQPPHALSDVPHSCHCNASACSAQP